MSYLICLTDNNFRMQRDMNARNRKLKPLPLIREIDKS